MRDSAVLVKEALEEAERAQAAASQAIRQANTDIQDTNKLLSSVRTAPSALSSGNTSVLHFFVGEKVGVRTPCPHAVVAILFYTFVVVPAGALDQDAYPLSANY